MHMLYHLIDLNGVATRRQAWAAFLAVLVVWVLVGVLEHVAPVRAHFAAPLFGVTYVVLICTLVRRLHDTGVSGYWSLTLLIPVLGFLTLLYGLFRRTGRRYAGGHPVARVVGSLGLAVLFGIFVLRAVWVPFWIPSESMKPTLLIGDFLVVRHLDARHLHRGDVVVFRHPVNGQDFIVRLIGLPGDTIQMKNGVVFINGAEAVQTPDGVFEEVMEPQGPMANRPRCENGPVGEGGLCTKTRTRETLPEGTSHAVLNIDTNGYGDNSDVFTVPEGKYFFMGDNRDNSQDSRYSQAAGGVGFVPAEYLIGRADRIIFSAAGRRLVYFWTWRADRFFKAVE